MHLAVDTATFSIRFWGVLLMIAGTVGATAAVALGNLPMIWISGALAVAGLSLAAMGGWLLRHPAAEVQRRITRTLTLLGLSFNEHPQALTIRVPPIEVKLSTIGKGHTIACFRLSGRPTRRERLVIDALIKCQKTIRIII